MTDDVLNTVMRSMYGVDLKTSTAMPKGFVGVNTRGEGQPSSISLSDIRTTLNLMKVVNQPTPFDDGADIHPDTWNELKRQLFPDVRPDRMSLGTIHGIQIHLRDDVPPGKFWPCECGKDKAK